MKDCGDCTTVILIHSFRGWSLVFTTWRLFDKLLCQRASKTTLHKTHGQMLTNVTFLSRKTSMFMSLCLKTIPQNMDIIGSWEKRRKLWTKSTGPFFFQLWDLKFQGQNAFFFDPWNSMGVETSKRMTGRVPPGVPPRLLMALGLGMLPRQVGMGLPSLISKGEVLEKMWTPLKTKMGSNNLRKIIFEIYSEKDKSWQNS